MRPDRLLERLVHFAFLSFPFSFFLSLSQYLSMFSIRHQNRERRYGTVANSDLSDASSLEDDPHGRFVDALARIRRQRQEATINTFTCWCIRAAPILATATWTGTLIVVSKTFSEDGGSGRLSLTRVSSPCRFEQLLSICLFVDADGGAFRGDSAFPPLSDVVARHVSVTLFGTISTAVFLMQSLEQERFLRYRRVLVEATEDRWLWISVGLLDCVLGAAGSVALFLLPLLCVPPSPFRSLSISHGAPSD